MRDFAAVKGNGEVTLSDARFALERLEIDKLGLDQTDRSLLRALIKKFGGGPAGLETLAATINEDVNTIEDVYEPYLLQLGFIARTPRGRICLKDGYEHMGVKFSKKAEKRFPSSIRTNKIAEKQQKENSSGRIVSKNGGER